MSEPSSSKAAAVSPAQLAMQQTHPLLLPEILGFSPQLLLDDIINIANNAVQDGVNGMEEFLEKWMEEHVGLDESIQEIEQGLVAFQTLLEHHTDIAFDFFEAWSLRNIFAIPPDLPIVVPHQQGLDLTTENPEEKEKELMDEIEELRKRIENERRVKRLYSRALRATKYQRRRAEQCLERLSVLESPNLDTLHETPFKFMRMFEAISSLPPLDPSLTQPPLPDPSKRPWETSKAGYLNWAVRQLLHRAKRQGEAGDAGTLAQKVEEIGDADALRNASAAAQGHRPTLSGT